MSAPTESTEVPDAVAEAYRVGLCTFMGITLEVGPGALVPRPETELLGRTAARRLAELDAPPAPGEITVIDMCCGAGNLACALALGDPRLRVYAADVTDACVTLSRRNVGRLGLGARVSVHQGDLFGAILGDAALPGLAGTVDMVVANPPYISRARLGKDRAALLEREPLEAFDGGPYGISLHQRLVRDAATVLRPGGWLLFEFGLGQEKQIRMLFDRASSYGEVGFVADEAGAPRVAVARRPPREAPPTGNNEGNTER